MMSDASIETAYTAEMDFLKRKVPGAKISWQARPALSQIISAPLGNQEADKLVAQYQQALGERAKQAGVGFDKIIFSAASKLSGGARLVVSISHLRDVFAGDIDGDSGGGGRGYNPFATRPTRGGR